MKGTSFPQKASESSHIRMKYYRVSAKINLDAIGENLKLIKAKIPDGVMIMAIVKADAYGHGAVTVAEYLRDRVDWFGVACVEEALELRRNGIDNPMLILGYTSPDDYETVAENNITVSVGRTEDAVKLSETAVRIGKTVDIHIQIDTGMARLGFTPTTESAEQVAKISQLPNINISGIYSHYATADEEDKTLSHEQKALYEKFIGMAEEKGVRFPVKHLSNSAGTEELDSYYDMVRCGIIMYGFPPSGKQLPEYPLCPAMELSSRVIFVKTVEAGTGISYGHTFVADRKMKIATVSIGYADGYPRALSDKGCMIVRGTRCPIIGRVCMDQLMLDVSHVDGICVGDEATAVGNNGNEFLSVEEVSGTAGSFNYEFICGLSRRVPRVYLKDGKEFKTVTYLEA